MDTDGSPTLGRCVRLPDELVEMIVDAAASLSAPDATVALRHACLISPQYYRIAKGRLARSPVLRAATPRAAEAFYRRLLLSSGALALEAASTACPSEEEAEDPVLAARQWASQLRKLQIVGQAGWRHRATVKTRPFLITPATLVAILNQCAQATSLECLALVELPWVSAGFVGHVRPWPATLTKLLLLTPSTSSELFSLLHNFVNLEHLAIGSCDSEDPRLGMIAYTAPAPYSLKSFGIVCRTAERWLKTGLPWGLRDLQWIVRGRSLERLTSVHLELADDDDVISVVEMLEDVDLDHLRLRSVTQMTMTAALLLCKGLKHLHLSSIYATALRSTSTVWAAIPDSIEHLSIDVTRLEGHGPWNARSAAGLAGCLAGVVSSGRCKSLRTIGCIFQEPGFGFSGQGEGSAGTEMEDMRRICKASGVRLVRSTFDGELLDLAMSASTLTSRLRIIRQSC